MKITLLAENKSGTLYQASLIIKRHGYKIEQQLKESTNDSNQILYSFILSGDGKVDGLIEALAVIRYVQKVEIILQNGVDTSKKDEDQQRKLVQMAQDLITNYPDFIGVVRDIDNNPEISKQSMVQLGQYVGQGLVNQGKIKQISTNKIAAVIRKLILPACDLFAIAQTQGNTLKFYANPFCINKTSEQPSCYFLQGMIEGLLESVDNLPKLAVNETTCKATGADCCTFIIKYRL